MKNTITILGLVLGIIAIFFLSQGNGVAVGNIFTNENAYESGVVYSSTTISNGVATKIFSRATSSRTYAQATNISNTIVHVYKQATSTGVTVNAGTPIYSSSTNYAFVRYDSADPYIGEVWMISDTTSTLYTEIKQE